MKLEIYGTALIPSILIYVPPRKSMRISYITKDSYNIIRSHTEISEGHVLRWSAGYHFSSKEEG